MRSVGAQSDAAGASRFAFREVTGSGGYSYRSVATEEVRGSIAEGIACAKVPEKGNEALRAYQSALEHAGHGSREQSPSRSGAI